MSKLNNEERIKIYYERKSGKSAISLGKQYNISRIKINYLVNLIDKHGVSILRKDKNRKYPISFKEDAINRVLLEGESLNSVALDIGLISSGILYNWISKYKENDYNIVERKRGRPTMEKLIKKKDNESDKEKIKRLEEENLYLKAELEYSKKLRAVVQVRKNQQQKKK